HDVERAAALEAGRSFLVQEVHRHLDVDGGVTRHAQEVDVQGRVLHRVELEVARDGAGLAAVDVDLEHGGQETAGEDQALRLVEVERDRLRRFAETVDDCGDTALTANGTGGPLADPLASRGLELLDSGHGFDPLWSRNRNGRA